MLPCLGNVVCWRLAPPTTFPGHGSTFQRLPHQRRTRSVSPYMTPPTPLIRRHRKCHNTRMCKDHICGSCTSCPSIAVGWCGMNRGGPNAPLPRHFATQMQKTVSALPGSASVLPGDIAGDRAHICARYQSRPPPGSLIRLPGEFQVTG